MIKPNELWAAGFLINSVCNSDTDARFQKQQIGTSFIVIIVRKHNKFEVWTRLKDNIIRITHNPNWSAVHYNTDIHYNTITSSTFSWR